MLWEQLFKVAPCWLVQDSARTLSFSFCQPAHNLNKTKGTLVQEPGYRITTFWSIGSYSTFKWMGLPFWKGIEGFGVFLWLFVNVHFEKCFGPWIIQFDGSINLVIEGSPSKQDWTCCSFLHCWSNFLTYTKDLRNANQCWTVLRIA